MSLRRSSAMLSAVFVTSMAAIGISHPAGGALAGVHTASAGGAPNTFVPTGAMPLARQGATATLLDDGDVLVAGGGTSAADIYDPATRTFRSAGAMAVTRTDATATLLADGDVLVAGGCCKTGDPSVGLRSAEVYDPSTGTWATTGSLHVPRSSATATLLHDGDVLVAGGACNGEGEDCDSGSFLDNLRSAELYDPSKGTWTVTGSMRTGRDLHTATLLRNGEVLVTGGLTSCDDDFCFDSRSAELYDPSTGRWTATGPMHSAREQHSATLLADGDVLVAGGYNEGGSGNATGYSTAELYHPQTGTWSPTGSMAQAHVGQTASLLRNGWVLVAGGQTASAQIYEPALGTWLSPGRLSTVRTDQTATVLPSGQVLVAGGAGPDGQPQATAELYTAGRGPLVGVSGGALVFGGQQVGTESASQTFTLTNDGSAALRASGVEVSGQHPSDFAATSDCQAAPVAPGASCTVTVQFAPTGTGPRSAVVAVADNAPLDPQGATVSGYGGGPDAWVPTGPLAAARDGAAATLLHDGDVLVAGGEDPIGSSLSSAELYDPAAGTSKPTQAIATGLASPTLVTLRDGDALVFGGYRSDFSRSAAAELYDPSAGTWRSTGSMLQTGSGLTATLLDSGDVLATGYGDTAEVYDPTTGTWTATGHLVTSQTFDSATLLAAGDVLVTGGSNAAAELYDPSTDSWAATGSMHVARQGSTASLLRNGEVLVEGGDTPGGGAALASAELYDPTTGTWRMTGSMTAGRYGQTSTTLPDGTVLVTGGCTGGCDSGSALATSEVYQDGYWQQTGPMTGPRVYQTATLLPSGDLFVAGGDRADAGSPLSSAEVFTPTLLRASPAHGRVGQTTILTGNGFYAGELITVTWDGTKVIARAITTDRGTFVVRATVPPSPSGPHTIAALGQAQLGRSDDDLHRDRVVAGDAAGSLIGASVYPDHQQARGSQILTPGEADRPPLSTSTTTISVSPTTSSGPWPRPTGMRDASLSCPGPAPIRPGSWTATPTPDWRVGPHRWSLEMDQGANHTCANADGKKVSVAAWRHIWTVFHDAGASPRPPASTPSPR